MSEMEKVPYRVESLFSVVDDAKLPERKASEARESGKPLTFGHLAVAIAGIVRIHMEKF